MAEILVLEDDRASREALVSMLCAISGHVAVKEAERGCRKIDSSEQQG